MKTAPVIACVGEAMIELNIDSPDRQIGFAGDVFNTAVYLARGLAGAGKVEFVSVIGRDALSDRMAAFIRAQDVGTALLRRHPERLPGIYSIAVDAAGERSFSYWRDRSAARTLFEDGFGALEGADLIYLSGITLAILPPEVRMALIDHLGGHPARIAFDSNFRPRLWEDRATAQSVTEAMWRITDIALPSLDDEMELFGAANEAETLSRLRGYGLTEGALKRGPLGPCPLNADAPSDGFASAARVIDTTAAGDSFNGAFLAAILLGLPCEVALHRGHDQAVKVVGWRGAIIPADSGA